ncbi:MAG: 50S ribosomal protein L4 [Chloroflexi bacterium]|nr:50S ribosomal protein L4 [Chloroflexota bacterium]
MKLRLHNLEGKVVRQVDVRDDVFDVPMNAALVHQVAVGQQANARQGTASTKTRSQVSGGGAKPRPQKGTGRARAGTIRAPQWKGGGVVFGPAGRSYRHRTPKRMKRQSLVAMLSDKARTNQLLVVESLELNEPKTREVVKALNALGADSSVLLVADGADETVLRCARNVPRLKMLPAALLNVGDLLNHRSVVMTLDAVRKAEELWGGPFSRRKRVAAVSTEE